VSKGTSNEAVNACRLLASSSDIESAYALRWHIFVDEQGVDPAIERDEHDEGATHIGLFQQGRLVACGRVVIMEDGWAKLGRICVDKRWRGKGVGRNLVLALIADAKAKRPKGIYASVQMPAKGFYDRLGFTTVGDVYVEADVPHIRMEYPAH